MSLVSTLLNGSNGSGIDTSTLEANMHVYESESFINNAFANLTMELCSVNEAYEAADVIGCVKVLTEGADPAILMEGMVSSGIDKLKAVWEKALAAVKKFFYKVIDVFKSIILTGKKFTKEFGTKLKNKAEKKKDFEYKGYMFTIEKGNAEVKKVVDTVSARFSTYVSNGLAPDKVAKLSSSELLGNLNLDMAGDTESKKSTSEIQDEVVKASGVAQDYSELKTNIFEAYRNGDSDKGKQTLDGGSSEVSTMISFIDTCNNVVSDLQKDQKKYESNITSIIKSLDKLKNKSSDNEDDNKKYKAASAISTACNAILNVHKTATNAKIEAYKACNRQYLAVLKSFLRSGILKESVALEAEDMDDFDMDAEDLTDDVAEAAMDGADDPIGTGDDIGVVAAEEGKCGKGKAVSEGGCGGKKKCDPLEEAMMYL